MRLGELIGDHVENLERYKTSQGGERLGEEKKRRKKFFYFGLRLPIALFEARLKITVKLEVKSQ